MEKNSLVAVYGSLRKGLHNHTILRDSRYIGTYNTLPEYNLYSLGDFPGLRKDGKTSIIIEIYEVSEETLTDLDQLEGYIKYNDKNNFYNKELITTPFGIAYCYFYNSELDDKYLVHGGDWLEHVNFKKRNIQCC